MGKTKLRNWVPAAVLRSPLHPILSHKTVIVTFRGRRSGQEYSTPVVYHQDGDAVIVATDSPWWRNFVAESRAQLHLRGREVAATGKAVTDPTEATELLSQLVRGVPSYRRWAGVEVRDGEPDRDGVRAAVARGRVPIRLRLHQPPP